MIIQELPDWLGRSLIAVLFILTGLICTGCTPSPTIRDFTTDGCSLFPDGSWCDCCFKHDQIYWRGGTAAERKDADEELEKCVKTKTTCAVTPWLMYKGVRFGGHPIFPTWYRWGYGWDYGRMYAPLTEAESKDAKVKLEKYFTEHHKTFCEE